jgi:NAD(P)-dependent dehydrogenase (short-subunit alcohol dehydrogenase family)
MPKSNFARPRRSVLLAAGALLASLQLACAPQPQPQPDPQPTAAQPAPVVPHAEAPVILVTGSTDGLGREVARQLAAGGAHVIVHGRSEERGTELVREIEADGRGSARFYRADLASLEEVRELGEAIRRDYDRLDVLVNNAGIGRGGDETRREVSADGHELRFAVNYLSGFLLTHTLLPLLLESAPSRIVNVASLSAAPIDFDDVMLERGYAGGRAYGQSKLAQVLFTFELARRLEGTGVTVNALHPATMMPTTMVLQRGGQPRSTIEEGVEAVLQLVAGENIGHGEFYNGLQPTRANAQAYDAAARARLWQLSERLTGVHFEVQRQ